MTTNTAPIQWRQAVVPREKRWKRPLIHPLINGVPDLTKLVPYQRCTTFISLLENTHYLQLWKMRKVAEGLAQKPDLLMLVGSLGPQPEDDEEYKPWRDKMDELCEQALEAADANAKSNIGTALHGYADRIDRGQKVGKVSKEYQKHLKNYEAATQALTPVHIERFLVNDQYEVGGTPDRLSMLDGHDKLIVTDMKTGNISWGMGKFAMQKAMYANSQFYNPENGERTTIPNIDLERALIIHVDEKTGNTRLVWVNIKTGWEDGVKLAASVRAWQKRKDFQSPYMPRDLVAEARASLVYGIAAAESADELYELWAVAGKAWLPEHTQLAAARKAQLNA